jgi:hypothetical protein
LKDVVLFAQVLDRPEEPLRILHESNQYTQGNGIADHLVSAEPDDACNCSGRQDFHNRIVNRMCLDSVFEGVHVGAVDFFELVVRALFAIEKLEHHDSGDVFLQIGVDSGDCNADAAVAFAHGLAEQCGCVKNHR